MVASRFRVRGHYKCACKLYQRGFGQSIAGFLVHSNRHARCLLDVATTNGMAINGLDQSTKEQGHVSVAGRVNAFV